MSSDVYFVAADLDFDCQSGGFVSVSCQHVCMIFLISFLCFILSDPFSMTGSQYSILYLDEYVSPPSPLYNFRPKGLVLRFLHLNALSVGHLIPFALQRSYSLEYPSISPVEWRLFLVLLMVFQGN